MPAVRVGPLADPAELLAAGRADLHELLPAAVPAAPHVRAGAVLLDGHAARRAWLHAVHVLVLPGLLHPARRDARAERRSRGVARQLAAARSCQSYASHTGESRQKGICDVGLL